MAKSCIFSLMSKEYPSTEFELHKVKTKVSLLLRSEAPIDKNEFTDDEWITLNSAGVIAGEAARTCYSPKLQTSLDYLEKSNKYREVTDSVIESTMKAGHLTTRQHVHYTFGIEGISRNAIYYLHSHPHHNSEMVSQRYVNFSETNPKIPDFGSPELNLISEQAAKDLIEGYDKLYEQLIPTAKHFLLERFPNKNTEKWLPSIEREAKKKAQEIARYLLPIGTPANLHHTISELTLIRLYHLSKSLPATEELKQIIDSMVCVVAQVDPSIMTEIGKPLTNEPIQNNQFDFNNFSEEFDELLKNNSIKLDLDQTNLSQKLARSVRFTLNKSVADLPDDVAIDLVLNPQKFSLLSSVYGEIVIDRLGQALNQINLSAVLSLSHVANEQFHRHRSFNHTEPSVIGIPQNENDIIIPVLLNHNPVALQTYLDIQKKHNQTLQYLLDQGANLSDIQYLLTNATRVRKSFSGPLGAFFHFIKTRTCLTAQEEIYTIAVSLAKQIHDLDPVIGSYFDNPAPCGVRFQAGMTPFCPEGDHFCGIRVWNLNINKYPTRNI